MLLFRLAALALALSSTSCLFGADVPTLLVSNETGMPGGWVQIKVMAGSPQLIGSCDIVLDLDPTIFGAITAVDAFSSAGDQAGVANIQGTHMEATVSAQSAGLGQLPGLPVLTISVPVLATARLGMQVPISIHATVYQSLGQATPVSVIPGKVTIGGSQSIQDITPGGGLLPPGSTVQIKGAGFTLGTAVQIDGVSIRSVNYLTPGEIDFTVGTTTDLTGKQVVVRDADGNSQTFFPSFHGAVAFQSPGMENLRPIFPQLATGTASLGHLAQISASNAVALENQTGSPVDVLFQSYILANGFARATLTIPPGAIYMVDAYQLESGDPIRTSVNVVASAPIRIITFYYGHSDPFSAYWPPPSDGFPSPVPYLLGSHPGTFSWQIGSALPAGATFATVLERLPPAPFTATATTSTGGAWLVVTPGSGMTCNTNVEFVTPPITACPESSQVTVSVDPSKLTPGDYTGTITVTPQLAYTGPAQQTVTLHVSASPFLTASAVRVDFNASAGSPPSPVTIQVTSPDGNPAAFSVNTNDASWLTVNPASGTTPATLTFSVNPASFNSSASGSITITGSANTLSLNTQLTVQPQPAPLLFSAQLGAGRPAAQIIYAGPDPSQVTFQSTTADGGQWLNVSLQTISAGVPPGVVIGANLSVAVDPAKLAAGTYHGTITFTSDGSPSPTVLQVTLVVWGAVPAVTASASSLSFSAAQGNFYVEQVITFTTGSVPVSNYGVTTSTQDGGTWLTAQPHAPQLLLSGPMYTPVQVGVDVYGPYNMLLAPGVYHGSVTFTAPPGSANSLTVPVTFTLTPPVAPTSQPGPPLAATVVNAASQRISSIAPGEIVSIYGIFLGPPFSVNLVVGPDGKVSTNLDSARIWFNGVPAPVLYVAPGQVNAVVPYEIDTTQPVTVQVEYNGNRTQLGGFSVASASPAIFTSGSAGIGQGAVLNQDSTVNGPSNPAIRGSVIQIFGTGEGETVPPGVTGGVNRDNRNPVLTVHVNIGGVDASVQFAGSAPGAVAGLLQVNAVVPQTLTPDSKVPVSLSIGGIQSPPGVTIAVK